VIDRLTPARRPLSGRMVMRQSWRDLLFLHWPIDPAEIQRMLPDGLTVDLFEGRAYIGLVPFSMRNVRPVGVPAVPYLSHFHEINVRTYVHRDGRDPGVYFFSLDAANRIAVLIARLAWGLPYFNADIRLRREGDQIAYESRRRPGWGATAAARSSVRYAPAGIPGPAAHGTLDHFLVERYLLYAGVAGALRIGQVHHTPYPLQGATLSALTDTLVASAGIKLPVGAGSSPPLVHYASGVDVEIYPLRRLI
jgi:uncharacterized protein YqjF (DUF2071 family)